MEKKDLISLAKMIEYIEHIQQYTNGINDKIEFQNNVMCLEAVCFDIIQIGELAKDGLRADLKQTITSIPWNQINGLRNRIVHGYGDIDHTIIWDVVKEDLPALKSELENIIKSKYK